MFIVLQVCSLKYLVTFLMEYCLESKYVDSFLTPDAFDAYNIALQGLPQTTEIKSENPPAPSENYIPIFAQASAPTFDWEVYKSHLVTSKLGRVVLLTETARSTTDFLEGPTLLHDGIAVIADRQTQGKGRAGNIWLSPIGKVNVDK